MNLAVLASHGGSTLQAILDACASNRIPNSRVTLVVSNNSGAYALDRARAYGVPTRHLSGATHGSADALDEAICSAVTDSGADWIMLAGYMKRLGPRLLRHFEGRILNTHPSLLPAFGGHGFYGRRVHEAVLAAGVAETGATMQLVTDEYDTGAILAQVRVPVLAGDTAATLEERVKCSERELVVDTLADLARNSGGTDASRVRAR